MAKPYGIPALYCDYGWDDFPESLHDAAARVLAKDARPWCLYLKGGFGSKKSTFAAACLLRWRMHNPPLQGAGDYGQDMSGLFVPSTLATRMLRNPDTSTQSYANWATTPMLVLDDLGAERDTDHLRERISHILLERYENKRKTIITTNLSVDEFGRRTDQRIKSRLSQAIIVDMGEKDARMGVNVTKESSNETN